MGLKTAPKAGTVVRLTGKFLAQTGQQKGPEGMGRWKVVACTSGLRSIPKVAGSPIAWEATGKPCDMCAGGQYVAVNQPALAATDPTGYEDVPAKVREGMVRHFHLGNLEIVGAPPKAEDYEIPHR